MDFGDFIYIIIAIALAVLNAAANSKKKKAAMQRKQEAAPIPSSDEDELKRKLQELLGQEVVFVDEPETKTETAQSPQSHETSEPAYGERWQHEEVTSSYEYSEPLDKPLSEAELYPIQEQKPIDVSTPVEYTPIDIAESKVEGPIGDYDYQESFNASLEQVEPDEQMEEEQGKEVVVAKESLLADFDPVKAVVYSEIMRPKFF